MWLHFCKTHQAVAKVHGIGWRSFQSETRVQWWVVKVGMKPQFLVWLREQRFGPTWLTSCVLVVSLPVAMLAALFGWPHVNDLCQGQGQAWVSWGSEGRTFCVAGVLYDSFMSLSWGIGLVVVCQLCAPACANVATSIHQKMFQATSDARECRRCGIAESMLSGIIKLKQMWHFSISGSTQKGFLNFFAFSNFSIIILFAGWSGGSLIL